jgi:hypothetical protein
MDNRQYNGITNKRYIIAIFPLPAQHKHPSQRRTDELIKLVLADISIRNKELLPN